MALFIRPTERVKHVRFHLYFEDLEKPGCGYSFDCNRLGWVSLLVWLTMPAAGRKSLALCRSNPARYRKSVVREEWTEVVPAAIRCVKCEAEVVLDDAWANGCPNCPAEYNLCGQLLAPRSEWGEETGELGQF